MSAVSPDGGGRSRVPRVYAGASDRPGDSRIALIDNARAIGIVLVVLGHAPALPAWASNLIFAFHMPLFFLLSGLVVSRDRLSMPIGRRALLLAKSLLVPYLFYFALAFAYWLLAKRHGLRSAEFETLPWWDPLLGLVTGDADRLYVDVVLWFFPCLFVTAMAHHVACRITTTRVTAIAAAVVTIAYIVARDPTAARWWWSADCAIVAVGFYALGAAANPALRHIRRTPARARLAGLAAVGALACAWMTFGNGHVDLNRLAFGRHAFLYVPTAISGIVAVLAASALLDGSAVARWLSINTLVIFPIHFLLFSVFTGIALEVLHLPPDFKEATAATSLVYTGAALLACWPIARCLQKYVPWLFHQGRVQAVAAAAVPHR